MNTDNDTAITRNTRQRNESGFRGVYKIKNTKLKRDKWYASFRGVYLGSFNSPEEAARAYNKVVIAAGYSAFANHLPGEPEPAPAFIDVKKLLSGE